MRRAAAVLLAALLCGCGGAGSARGGKGMPVKFIVSPRQESWIAGTEVVIALRIENHGDTAFETPNPMFATSPQPLFRVRRPGGAEETFAPSKIADGAGGNVVTVTIPPAHVWEGELTLSSYVDMKQPGTYEIAGEIASGGVQAKAAAAKFEIRAAQFADISASLSRSEDGIMNRELVFLQPDAAKPRGIAAPVTEHEPMHAELNPLNFQQRALVPPGAQHVHGVYANYATPLDPLRWFVASDARTIYVSSNDGPKTTAIAAAAPLLRVLSPLATREPDLYVLAFTELGPASALGFAALGKPGSLPASAQLRTVWRMDGRPAAAEATLAPHPQGSRILVAATQQADTGVRLKVVILDRAGALTNQTDRFFPGLAAGPASAAFWADDGRIHISFLAASQRDAARLHLIEAIYKEDLSLTSPPAVPAPLSIRGPAARAAISYFEQEGGLTRAAMIQAQDGTTYLLKGAIEPRDAGRTMPAAAPFALVPGRSFWYLFWLTPGGVASRSF